jgi:uncharacterized protein
MGVATTIERMRPWSRSPLSRSSWSRGLWRGGLRPLLVAAALALLAAPAAAQSALPEFPQLSGRVVDEADILPDSVRVDLVSKLARLEAKTSDQLVVVTLRSLRGQTIEQYGVALGRHWKVGQKDKNNGVLLIVAPTDRKVRIEVGYGLEGVLPDAVAKYIIEHTILPHFRASDMAGGVARGVDDLIQVLTGDSAEWKQRAAPSVGSRVAGTLGSVGGLLVGLLFAAVFLVFFAVIGWIFVSLLVHFLIWIGALPKKKDRKGAWRSLNYVDYAGAGVAGSSFGSSGSSGGFSGGGFSGGGGDFGGGGASGSW